MGAMLSFDASQQKGPGFESASGSGVSVWSLHDMTAFFLI